MKKLGRKAAELLYSFQKNLDKANKGTGKKEIHNLRLDLKELFALLNILELCIDGFPKEYKPSVKAIRSIFKLTGEIRDNQLVEKHAKEILPLKAYKAIKKNTAENIEVTKQKLKKALRRLDLEDVKLSLILVFGETSHIKGKMIVLNLKHRIKRDEEKIRKELNKKNANYHQVRRLIKEQYFLLLTLRNVFKEEVKQKQVKRNNRSGKLLGDWHDLIILRSKMSRWKVALPKGYLKLIHNREARLLKQAKRIELYC